MTSTLIYLQEEKVREKTYGKQKVYLINQAGLPESTTDELKAMDALIESKEKNLRVLEVRLKEAQAELRAVNAQMPTVDAEALLDQVSVATTIWRRRSNLFKIN